MASFEVDAPSYNILKTANSMQKANNEWCCCVSKWSPPRWCVATVASSLSTKTLVQLLRLPSSCIRNSFSTVLSEILPNCCQILASPLETEVGEGSAPKPNLLRLYPQESTLVPAMLLFAVESQWKRVLVITGKETMFQGVSGSSQRVNQSQRRMYTRLRKGLCILCI